MKCEHELIEGATHICLLKNGSDNPLCYHWMNWKRCKKFEEKKTLYPFGVCDCGLCFDVEERNNIYDPLICVKCGKEVKRRGMITCVRHND